MLPHKFDAAGYLKNSAKRKNVKSAFLQSTGIVTVEAAIFLSVLTASLFVGLVVLRDDTEDILCNVAKDMRYYAGYDVSNYVCAPVDAVTDGEGPAEDPPPEDPVGSSTMFTEYADTVDFTSAATPVPFAGPQNALGGNDIVTLPSSLAAATAYGFTSLSFDGGAGTDTVTVTSTQASEVWTLGSVEVADVSRTDVYQSIALTGASPSIQIGDFEKIDVSNASGVTTLYPYLASALADFGTAPTGTDTLYNYLHLSRSSYNANDKISIQPTSSSTDLKVTTENISQLEIVRRGTSDFRLWFNDDTFNSPTSAGVYGNTARTLPLSLRVAIGGPATVYLPDRSGQTNYLNFDGKNVTLEGIRYRFGTIASGTRINALTAIAAGGGIPSLSIEDGITPDAYGNRFIVVDPMRRPTSGTGGYTVNGSEFQLYIDASVPSSTYRLSDFVIRSQSGSDGSVTFAKSVSVAGAFPQTFYLNETLGYIDMLQEEVADGTCSTSTTKYKTLYGESVNAGFGICYNSYVTLSDGNTANAIAPSYTLDVPPSAPVNATTGFPSAMPVVLHMGDAISQSLTVSGEAVVSTNSSNNNDVIPNSITVSNPDADADYGTRVMVYSQSSSSRPDIINFEPGADFYISNGSYDGTTCTDIRIQLPDGVTYDSLFVGEEIFSGDVMNASTTIGFGSTTYTAQGTEFMLAGSRFMLGGFNATRTGLDAFGDTYTYYAAPPRSCFIDG